MTLEIWMMFSMAAFFNIFNPEPAIIFAISNGINFGLKAVIVSAIGNVLGLLILSTVSMFGLGLILILQTSTVIFTSLKILFTPSLFKE